MLSIGGIWTTTVTGDEAWNREESLRTFAIVMSGFNLVIKIIICGLMYWYKNLQSKTFMILMVLYIILMFLFS